MKKLFYFLLVALGIYLYIGLYFPDPYYFGKGIGLRALLSKVLAIIRVAIPLIAVILLILVRRSIISKQNLALATIGIVSGFLMLFAIGWFRDFVKSKHALVQYHPYLQLAPDLNQVKNSSKLVKTSLPLPKSETKIFFLGGSTTQFLNSKGIGWPSMVKDRLNKPSSDKLDYANQISAKPINSATTYNFGRQWYTSQHISYYYQTSLRHHKPDVIVVMEAINDLLHNADFSYLSTGPFRDDYSHFLGPMVGIIKEGSFPLELFKLVRSAFYHTPRKVIDTETFIGLNTFKRHLNTIADLAMVDGTRLVLMTQPNVLGSNMKPEDHWRLHMLNYEAVGPKFRWSISTVKKGLDQYNQAIREVALERGVQLIDLERKIPKNFSYFNDEVHYTDKAFPLIANEVASGLKESSNPTKSPC